MNLNFTKGKILRVKTGYNPNSSSVGSQIPILFMTVATASSVLIVIMNILKAKNGKNSNKNIKKNEREEKI